MPTDACVGFYPCRRCGRTLRPKRGDCCVFCSYGTVPCPPIQQEQGSNNGAIAVKEATPREHHDRVVPAIRSGASEASMTNDEITARILRLVALVEKDEASRAVLSTRERIAVALVLDRKEWLDQMPWPILGAIDRLGE